MDSTHATPLEAAAGHWIRRAHQAAVAAFNARAAGLATPVQYAILKTLERSPGIDQVTLAEHIALDNSTTADTAARMEAKGLVRRELRAKRQRSLTLTEQGRQVLGKVDAALRALDEDLLRGLSTAERVVFLRMLQVVAGNAVGDG